MNGMNKMTRRYDVTICEVLKRTVSVQAESVDEAHSIVEREWKEGMHVLGAGDFKEVDFSAIRHKPARDRGR